MEKAYLLYSIISIILISNLYWQCKRQLELFDPNKIEIAYKTLEKVVDILNEHNIPYYLDCGTLLGCVRENKLLDHDTDVDVTLHLSFWDKIKEIDFSKYGFVKWRQSGDNIRNKIISVKFSGEDIYCDIYLNPAFPILKDTVMKNKVYSIPIHSDIYLTELYGDWRKPSGKHADWPMFFYNGLVTGAYSKYWDKKYKIM